MDSGLELRRARRAANLTLAQVAALGGLSVSHLSRIEAGKRPATPATIELYQRAVRRALDGSSSPTVDDMKRSSFLALAGVAVAGTATPTRATVDDLDECAQWIAWEIWRGDGCGLPESAIPAARRPAAAQLIRRRQVVRTSAGVVRFPHPGLLDFHLACGMFAGITSRASGRLETAQTSHTTDLVIREFVQQDPVSATTLRQWMTSGASDVLRVNAAGILAKVGTSDASDRVIAALRTDGRMRSLYLTAVASRVLSLPWQAAARVANGAGSAPDDVVVRLSEELRNPRDAAARWCSAVLLHQVGASNQDAVRVAVADVLRAESVSENLRTMAALLAGTDPITMTPEGKK